ncbi:MAG: hypothetical protein WC729_21490 [Sphingomonas sp.]|jgi:hypothetical protein|uniref:hypothetical protein n=1 Tax=Sphingomonas sp. TaxID=28214 RepID=UPI00356245A6
MFDWIGRTLLLVLSGLATFAILASLESASRGNGTLRNGMPPMESAPDPRAPPPDAVREALGSSDARPGTPTPAGQPVQRVAVPGTSAQDAGAQLLEALTYAVLALAGFAAAILIVLLRITGYLARIAERS